MDVLRPQIIQIGERFYRKNPTLQRDVNADEEEEFNWQNGEYRTCTLHVPVKMMSKSSCQLSSVQNIDKLSKQTV